MAMRKFYVFALTAAVAAASLVSCQKEVSDPNEGLRTVHFTVRASLDNQTKTYLNETGGVYSAKWSYDPSKNIADQIGVFFGDFENNVNAVDATFEITDVTNDVATFSGDGTVSAEAVKFTSFYPASAFTRTYANSCLGLKVEKTQNPVLGSFDPNMDILIGKQKDITISSTDVELDDLQFARVMAILRVNVKAKNDQATVSDKTITSLKLVAANTTLTGTASVSAENGTITTWNQSNNEVIANIDENEMVTVNVDDFNAVYLVVNPATIAAGTSLTFTVGMSDGTTYTRVITAPAMEFLAAKVTEINLTLRDTDLVEADYSGDYIVVSKGAATNWAVMNKTVGTSSNASYLTATATEVAYDADVDFTSSSVTFGDFSDADHKWTFTKVSGGYTIVSSDGKYLDVESATHATLNDDSVTLKVEAGANNVYSISNANGSLALKYNSSSPRFTFYASGQQDLYLIPFEETCKTPVISCSNNQVSITCGTTGATVYYTTDGSTTPTSSSTAYSAPFTISANTTIKAIAIKEGLVSSAVVTQLCELSSASYVKVEAAPSNGDWSGTYLIVAETGGKVLIPEFNSTTGAKATGVTISSKAIASNSTIDSYAWTIEKVGNTSNYTIKNGSLYLGCAAAKSARSYDAGTTDNAKNTFSISNSAAVISCVGVTDSQFRYNSQVTDANGPFRFYTSTAGEAAVLYKLDDGKSSAEISYSPATNTITFGDALTQPTLNNAHGLTVSYVSGATGVATVNNDPEDANFGKITVIGAGDAVITASWLEQTISNVTYRAGSTTYTLKVNKATPTIADFAEASVSIAVDATGTPQTTTISNGLSITYTSSDPTVARIDNASTGALTGLKDGTTTINATFAGNANYNAAATKSYTIVVGTGGGQNTPTYASVNDVLWAETFEGYANGSTPTTGGDGTTVYGGGSITYACYSSSSTAKTQIYASDNNAGGEAPELLIQKSSNSGSFTVSGIPTGGAKEMSLTFLSNKTTFSVTSNTTNISLSGSGKSWTITNSNSAAESFEIIISNSGGSNARVDEFEIKVTVAHD